MSLLLAALPAGKVYLAQAELTQEITGAAQEIAGEAHLPAGLRGELCSIRRQLNQEDFQLMSGIRRVR